MAEDLLYIVEREATKYGQTSVQPDVLRPGECADSGGWENQGSEARDSNESNTGKERTSEVEVFLLLSGSTNE